MEVCAINNYHYGTHLYTYKRHLYILHAALQDRISIRQTPLYYVNVDTFYEEDTSINCSKCRMNPI